MSGSDSDPKRAGNSMEGGVYKCRLSRIQRGFRLEVSSQPTLFAVGPSIEDAVDQLRDLICAKRGDGEAFLEFLPPPSLKNYGRKLSSWYALEYNEIVHWDDQQRGELWTKGHCRRCLQGLGDRTSVIRNVAEAPRTDFAGLYTDRNGCCLCSERLTDILVSKHPKLPFRKVEFQSRSRRVFFEVFPRETKAFVLSRNLPAPVGWKCPDCHLFYAPQYWTGSPGGEALFMLGSDLAAQARRRVAWAGIGVTIRLLVHKELASSASFKALAGIIRVPVATLEPRSRRPVDLATLKKFA